jgi:hypothetical protein
MSEGFPIAAEGEALVPGQKEVRNQSREVQDEGTV